MSQKPNKTSFLKHPLSFLDDFLEEIWLKRIEEESKSEKSYFCELYKLINRSKHHLLFFGYDSPFMEKDITTDYIKKAIDRTVLVQAIIPNGPYTFLENHIEYGMIELVKIQEPIPKGYIIFDTLGVAIWDSTNSTHYSSERNSGFYFREILLNSEAALEFGDSFQKDWMKFQE